ncbi:MAG TPA: helix-turn-helix domain-containing protein [Trebonia sp.]|nr:helix-turn-helix domain-containing protein [Trebonia sp.]
MPHQARPANSAPAADADARSALEPGAGLGQRLRAARVQRNMSVRELARQVGCSASLVSQVERGLSMPSVGVLYSLATVLQCSLDKLLFGPAGSPAGAAGQRQPATSSPAAPPGDGADVVEPAFARPGIVQRAATRRVIDMASGVRWERLTPSHDDRADFLEVVYSPGGHSTDQRQAIRHQGYEYGVIISGTLEARVGFETYELAAGDSIAFDSIIPHEYLNKTGDFVHAIWLVLGGQGSGA